MLDLSTELDRIEKKGLWRTLRRLDAANTAETTIESKQQLLLSSNNYLGLATDPRLKEAAIKAINEYGTGSGGARLTTGNLHLHEELEQTIASFKKTEAALLFSSGYLANVGTISSMAGKADLILSDAYNHASIIDGCRLSKAKTVVYGHVNMDDLQNKLIENKNHRRRFIVTDGVFSMDGNIAPLPEITLLAAKHGAKVIVDDAHATSVIGENGTGTAEYFGLESCVDITIGTLSKAAGCEGGFVAASRLVIDYLRNRARTFIFQTSLSPGVVAAATTGLHIINSEPERRQILAANADFFRTELRSLGFNLVNGETPILAVIIGEAEAACQFSSRLEEEGIFAPAIRPPTVPDGESRIRATLMATHTKEHLQQAISSFEKVGKDMGVI